jgi:endonuclease-3
VAPFAEMSNEELVDFLTSIGGIGIKTAACAMMFALDRDLCAVDTHIHRVLNRMGIVTTNGANKTYEMLQPLIPEGHARELHVLLIHHGRSVCKARNPHCFECPVYDLCDWPEREAYAAEGKQGPKPVSGDFLITDVI